MTSRLYTRKVAVVAMSTKLGNEEKGLDRFRYLAAMLVEAGFEVDFITSSFQHWEKAQRDTSDPAYKSEPFNVVFIDEPGYKKNIDLARIKSHAKAAKNLQAYLDGRNDYDLVYSEVPPNDAALVCAKYAEKRGIPYVADVNDLWPEAMRMVVDIPIVSNILFYPFARDARETYRRCAAVVGTSDEYASRPFKDTDRPIDCITVYVGNEVRAFDEEVAKRADSVSKPAGEFWVSYAGSIGASYDIKTMVRAAGLLKEEGHLGIAMKILGDGPQKEEAEELAASLGCDNVEFVGYMPHDIMAAFLSKSDILVNSYVRKAPQSIVSKVGDYLAAGKPMINTCMSPEFRNKVEGDGFGINVEPEDPHILSQAILELKENPSRRWIMGKKARIVAETEFDRPVSYRRIVELLEKLIEENESQKA